MSGISDAGRIASVAYFRALRRTWIVLNPGRNAAECPIIEFATMDAGNQRRFAAAMEIALKAGQPENVRRVLLAEQNEEPGRSQPQT